MSIKIAITGPESAGKTTLAQILALHYHTSWVPEFARDYLSKLNRPYTPEDLNIIAKGQLEAESSLTSSSGAILICDTDMTVIKVWSEYRYGFCDKLINDAFEKQHYELYLLCRPDFDWEPDPLRENPNDRELLFEKYESALLAKKVNYAIIEGTAVERIAQAIVAIDQLL
ncbi:MAG: AAA family ATPase [Saprospiraceae bacterium]